MFGDSCAKSGVSELAGPNRFSVLKMLMISLPTTVMQDVHALTTSTRTSSLMLDA